MPQVFLRLCGCNLKCAFCDTPGAREKSRQCLVVDRGGREKKVPNPVEVSDAAYMIYNLWVPARHSVSITGGEPLLQGEELAVLLPLLKERGIRIYLETNGTLHEHLGGLLPWLDWIAMDVKLPSTQGGISLLEDHRRFLRLALSKKVFLKVVIDGQTQDEELARACSLLAGEAGDVPVVLQPVTPQAGGDGISPYRVDELYGIAIGFFDQVRVIPQMHRLWGAR